MSEAVVWVVDLGEPEVEVRLGVNGAMLNEQWRIARKALVDLRASGYEHAEIRADGACPMVVVRVPASQAHEARSVVERAAREVLR